MVVAGRVQFLYNAINRFIEMDSVISALCYKGTILQRNYMKMTISWSFSYNYFVKFHGKEFGNHKMTGYIQF